MRDTTRKSYGKTTDGHLVIVRLLPTCPVCFLIIEKVGIKRVIYTTGDGYCEERL